MRFVFSVLLLWFCFVLFCFVSQCNIVFQRLFPGNRTQVAVNHIQFNSTVPLMNISVDTVHEWAVTSNFHQFHQHTWPYQVQVNVVEGWLAQAGDWHDTLGKTTNYKYQNYFFRNYNNKYIN